MEIHIKSYFCPANYIQKSPWKNILKTKKKKIDSVWIFTKVYAGSCVDPWKNLRILNSRLCWHLKQFLNFKLKAPMVQEKIFLKYPNWLLLWSLKIFSYKNNLDSSATPWIILLKTLQTLLFLEPIFLQHRLNPPFWCFKNILRKQNKKLEKNYFKKFKK